MIKCPNCGSSAQPKLVANEYHYTIKNKMEVVHRYKCGCGCKYKIILTPSVVQILNKDED